MVRNRAFFFLIIRTFFHQHEAQSKIIITNVFVMILQKRICRAGRNLCDQLFSSFCILIFLNIFLLHEFGPCISHSQNKNETIMSTSPVIWCKFEEKATGFLTEQDIMVREREVSGIPSRSRRMVLKHHQLKQRNLWRKQV